MPHPVLTNGGTSAEWGIENPILPAGVTGTETDTGRKKIGNGSSYWSSLRYTDEEIGPEKQVEVRCDGIFDEKKINKAINELSKIGGGIVQLIDPQNGNCNIRSAILLKSNIWLRGTGKTTLKLDSISYASLQGLANVIFIYAETEDLTNIRISDLNIDGNRANQALGSTADNAFNGICVRGNGAFKVSDFVIENVTSYNNGYHGIAVYDRTENFVIRNNYLYGNGFRPIHVHSVDASNVSKYQVTGNRANGNGIDAETGLMAGPLSGIFVVFDNTSQVIVSGNTVWNEKGVAYDLNGKETAYTNTSEHALFSNNVAIDCGVGLKVSGLLKNTSITGNTFKGATTSGKTSGSSGAGIHFASAGTEGSEGIIVSNNIITGCESWGIQFDTASGGWNNFNVSGNLVSENGTKTAASSGGVQLKSFTGVVTNNVINSNNVGAGAPRQLYVFSATNSIISNNYVNGGLANYPALIVEAGSTGNVLSGNFVNRNNGSGTAVQIIGASNIIKDTILQGSNTVSVTGANVTGLRADATTTAGALTATMTNAPVAGNPTKWVAVNVAGTVLSIPAW